MPQSSLLGRLRAVSLLFGLIGTLHGSPALAIDVPVVDTPPLPIPGLPVIDLPDLPLPFDPEALLGTLLFDPGNLLGGLVGGLDEVLVGLPGELLGPVGPIGGTLMPTPGTETFTGTIVWDGLARSYAGIRPMGSPPGAPVIILLHPRAQSPARTANLTRIGRLAAQYGAWIFLPAAVGAAWSDNPSIGLTDDVGFLDALLRREVADHGLDASRVYALGYSNGGFMAERLACERPEQLAGIGIVAASVREGLARRCTGPRRMPVVMFNGTLDVLTPYAGAPGMSGAVGAAAFWAARNQCAPADTTTTPLPDIDRTDGTTATVTRYNRCVDSTVALYTIVNGGHTWPGTPLLGYTFGLGATSGDVDATLEIWNQLSPYSRPSPL